MSLKKAILTKIEQIGKIDNNSILETNLNEEELNYIQELINKNPEIYTIIEEKINKILFNDKINIYEVPIIIEIISDIYYANLLDVTTTNVNLKNITLFTLDILIESKLSFPAIDESVSLLKEISFIKIKNDMEKLRKKCCSCFC